MANPNISVIDAYGRVVIPKEIREKMNSMEVVFIYDEKHEDVHMVPVTDITEWKGKFKGILKDYLKTHEEDSDDTYRR